MMLTGCFGGTLIVAPDFTASPVVGRAPLVVQFTSYLGSYESWRWDFGDGTYSDEENPIHTYTSPGDYTVALIAQSTENGTTSRTRRDYIQVLGPIPTDGLVACYEFDGDTDDHSGFENHGTAFGSIRYVEGVSDSSLKLPGYPYAAAPMSYIVVPEDTSLRFASAFSIACFVRIDGTSGMCSRGTGNSVDGERQCIFGKRGDRQGLWCNVLMTDDEMQLQFGIDFYDPPSIFIDVTVPYSLGTWAHLAITYRDGLAMIYIDGDLVAQADNPAVSLDRANVSPLYIGAQRNSGIWYPLDGALDEFRIYNRALSREEINSLVCTGK